MEDFTQLRLLAKKLNRTKFRHGWQFRIDITSPFGSPPEDFDLYVKDITYDPITIETESEKIGGHTFNWPVGAGTSTVSMTMRDNSDERIRKWFQSISGSIVSEDGTINLINKVLCTIERHAIVSLSDGITEETLGSDIWKAIPTVLGPVTESHDEQGNLEFQITFIQHTTAPKFNR